MNILIGQNHLHYIGGTEKYTYDLVKELQSRKEVDNVSLIIPHSMYLGVMSDKIENDLGVKTNYISKDFINGDKQFDMCLINHNTTIDRLIHSEINYDKNNVFQIIHGTTPGVEQPYLPIHFSKNKDVKIQYITISQEISDYIKNIYNLKGIVINNGVDTDIFNSDKEINEVPKKLFSLSQSKDFNNRLHIICKKLDIQFSCANKWVNAQQDVSQDIKDSDIVVSLGRGVYESMMCGRYVIVADERGYQGGLSDGSINKDNIDKMMYSNCSGRAYMYKPTILHIKGEIEKYNKKDANFNKEYASKNLNIKHQVSKILELKK